MLDIFPTFKKYVSFFGNIEKCPFTYWLNGRWFLQIVDLGNFNMKLTGRCFPQIVEGQRESISNIYKKINCGVSFWTCWREISGDRVALFCYVNILSSFHCVWKLLKRDYLFVIRQLRIPWWTTTTITRRLKQHHLQQWSARTCQTTTRLKTPILPTMKSQWNQMIMFIHTPKMSNQRTYIKCRPITNLSSSLNLE